MLVQYVVQEGVGTIHVTYYYAPYLKRFASESYWIVPGTVSPLED